MSEETKTFQRWYDKDSIVSKCVARLEGIPTAKKHQAAAFLMEEIVSQPPYTKMLPSDIYNLVMGEHRSRRWYDFDEICKIFMELLRHAPEEIKRQLAVKTISFIEDNE